MKLYFLAKNCERIRNMYCPFYGKQIPDDSSFCPECGNDIRDSWEKQPYPPEIPRQPQKKTGAAKIILIVILILLVIAAGVIAAIIFLKPSPADKAETKTKSESVKSDKEDKSDKSAKDEAKAPADEEEDEEEKYDPTEGGIHRYEFIIADVTWSQAFADCKSRGGYLVRINSEEEYQYILKQLDAGSYQKIQFFIGGRRDSGSSEYYWADEDDELYGDQINTSSYWCSSEWLSGEPSFRDGANEEEYLDLLYYKNEGRWTWNDAPNDILAVVPSFSGRIGYICEYED